MEEYSSWNETQYMHHRDIIVYYSSVLIFMVHWFLIGLACELSKNV